MEVTLISNESIILSTGRHVKGNEREMGKGMEESCNNKWRSISPTLLKTVGHVLTTRRWASYDAWRHHRRSFNAGIFFMLRLFCIHPGHISTNLLPTKSDLANYLLPDNIEFDGVCEISLKANRFQNHFRVRSLLVKLRDIWSFLIHGKDFGLFNPFELYECDARWKIQQTRKMHG